MVREGCKENSVYLKPWEPDNSLTFCLSRQKFVYLLSSFATHSAKMSVRKMNKKNFLLFKL